MVLECRFIFCSELIHLFTFIGFVITNLWYFFILFSKIFVLKQIFTVFGVFFTNHSKWRSTDLLTENFFFCVNYSTYVPYFLVYLLFALLFDILGYESYC